MALETLISWISRDLRQGSGSALVLATLVSFVGLFTAAAITMTMPLRAEIMTQTHVVNDRIFFSPPKHWQNASAFNRHISIRCRNRAFSARQNSTEAVMISVTRSLSLSCRNSERPVALLSYNISLWSLAKHKILEGTPLMSAAIHEEDHDKR